MEFYQAKTVGTLRDYNVATVQSVAIVDICKFLLKVSHILR